MLALVDGGERRLASRPALGPGPSTIPTSEPIETIETDRLCLWPLAAGGREGRGGGLGDEAVKGRWPAAAAGESDDAEGARGLSLPGHRGLLAGSWALGRYWCWRWLFVVVVVEEEEEEEEVVVVVVV